MSARYTHQVLRNENGRPVLVFAKGRKLYHAVFADDSAIRLVTVETLRGLTPMEVKGNPYPPRRCASYWLNHSTRPITPRAKAVLKGIVSRKQKEVAA